MFLRVKISEGPMALGSLDFAVSLEVAALQCDFIKCSQQHSPVCGFSFLPQVCLLSLQQSHIRFECNVKYLLISTYFGLLISFWPALQCHLQI